MNSHNETRNSLIKALQALQKTRQKLNALQSAQHEPIAVIGMACRFPGAETPEAFWKLLRSGADMVTEVPTERWNVDEYYDPVPGILGKTYVREAAFLDKIDGFDPQFFGISPREAMSMDPQHRLLLEVSWEALERAGQAPSRLKNSKTGVFVGVSPSEYTMLIDEMARSDTYVSTGNSVIFASGRLSYVLGLQGPNLVIDTACSASLIGVHLACESLRNGSSDLALAGGVHLMLSPQGHITMSQMQALAPDGRCKTFDAAANGFGRGEGCGIVVLKRLSDALANHDNILALIRGSAMNHDGPSSGLTVPSVTAQAALIHQALENGKVKAKDVVYVETHGTGTTLGDPIEIRALSTVFGKRSTPLLVGSVKTNFGHLEEAAGIASLMKVILAMHASRDEIPPHLHLQHPNPHIDWEHIAIRVPTERTKWPVGKKIAGVSSFGLGGSNAHVVLEEAPQQDMQKNGVEERPAHLLMLSAKSKEALQALVERYRDFLYDNPTISLGDLCYTAYTGRSHFGTRLSMSAASVAQLQANLAAVAIGQLEAGTQQASISEHQAPRIAFLFTGQGSQYVQMGRELYETSPTFRTTVDHCDQLLRQELGKSLLSILYPAGSNDQAGRLAHERNAQSLIDQTTYTQPALFILEYALATLWQSWGIQPDLLMGHSLGELVAACVAGVFTLEDGLKLVAARGRLMGALPHAARGEMVSLLASEAQVQKAIRLHDDVSIAAVNGPQSVVISGKRKTVLAIAEQLAAEGVKTRQLAVSHAFHSPLMEPILNEFHQVAASITYHKPTLRMISNVTGKVAGDEIMMPEYWVRHVREAVRFADGVATLHEQNIGIFLEIGPKPTLLGMAGQVAGGSLMAMLPSLRKNQSDWQEMLTSLGQLYVCRIGIDWESFDKDYQRHKVVLPTYPFQRQRYWVDKLKRKRSLDSLRPLIDKKMWLPRQKQTIFEKVLSTDTLPFLADHHVYGQVVVPGACHLSLALSGADLLFDGASCAIQDVIFPQALALFDKKERTVQLITEAHSQNSSSFQIISFAEDRAGRPAHETDEEPLIHATGRLVRSDVTAPTQSLTELQARCDTVVLPETLYDKMAEAQILLGPTFRWFAALWSGATGEALAQMQIPNAIGTVQGHRLFPTLIDACFQLVTATMSDAKQSKKVTKLPFALESLTVYAPTNHQELWCYAKRIDETKWKFNLFTATGQVIAQITGFQMRAVPPTAILGNRLRTDWLYTLNWEAHPLGPKAAQLPDCWLIFGVNNGVSRALVTQLSSEGTPTILVAPGATFRSSITTDTGMLQQATVDPTDPAMFRRLLAEVATRYRYPKGTLSVGIGYLWGIDEAIVVHDIPKQSLHLCAGLLHLVQALIDTEMLIHLWVVTQGCQSPHQLASANESHPLQAAAGMLWGLGRTIALEHPRLHSICIDLNGSNEQQVRALHREMRCPERACGMAPDMPPDRQILYQGDVRHVARLVRWKAPAVPEATLLSLGSYLITGGLGALGLEVAEQLVADGARHLILSGRRIALTNETQTRLRDWETQGVEVHIIQADVSRQVDVERLLAACHEVAPLRGIIHAAGVLSDGLIQNQTMAHFAQVMAAKVQGSWLLHTLTLETPLDFFVCFSSAASMLGSPGQSNYAAANAFMDTLMRQRRQMVRPGLSINWGPWGKVGMAATLQAKHRLRQEDYFKPMSPVQARRLLATLAWRGYLIAQDTTQIGVFDLDLHLLAQIAKHARGKNRDPSSLLASLLTEPNDKLTSTVTVVDLYEQLQSLSARERSEHLSQAIRTEVAQTLGISEPTQISLQRPLFELGLDSLMALELKNRFEDKLNSTLHSTLIFDYPTVSGLTTYLLTHLFEQTDGLDVKQMDSRSESTEDLSEQVAYVTQLSDDEAEALLMEKLSGL